MYRLVVLLLLMVSLIVGGCGEEPKTTPKAGKTLILYSELEPKFSYELVEAFNKKYQGKINAQVITELTTDGPKPDVVLAEQRTLNGLYREKKLKPVDCRAADLLPEELQHPKQYWYGAFYDPTVFLVNQEYSRKVGQNAIKSWEDLLRRPELRIAVENLSNTNSTQNFLSGFASARGESAALTWLSRLHRQVVKYANFPFSPIRMVAMGQADVALTRQSYVFKYLEASFPAYVVYPAEGSPINLYGVGVFNDCAKEQEAAAFMDWVVSSEDMQRVSLTSETGYRFILAEVTLNEPINLKQLWLNKFYLTSVNQERLTKRWLEAVRFSEQ